MNVFVFGLLSKLPLLVDLVAEVLQVVIIYLLPDGWNEVFGFLRIGAAEGSFKPMSVIKLSGLFWMSRFGKGFTNLAGSAQTSQAQYGLRAGWRWPIYSRAVGSGQTCQDTLASCLVFCLSRERGRDMALETHSDVQ